MAYDITFLSSAEQLSANSGYELVKFFFLMTFAAAIPAIISGGIAERARFYPMLVGSFFLRLVWFIRFSKAHLEQ